MDPISAVLGLSVLAAIIAAIVVPLTIVRSRAMGDLSRRLDRLEHVMHRFKNRLDEAIPAPTQKPLPPPTEPTEAVPVATLAAESEPAPPIVTAPRRPPETDWAAVESWIGGRGLGWTAMVLLVFAMGFFLKHVFERNLIGELGRVTIGITIGCGLAVVGYSYHRRGWRIFSQMLTAGGIAVLYLSTFASFGYYRLLEQQPAAFFLTILVMESFLLALVYDAPAIALMAVIGGLLAPVLLHTDQDQHRRLFAYLTVLDAGVVIFSIFRPWWAMTSVALVGTHILFWAWHAEHYHPAKLIVCLMFQIAVFVLFAGQGLASHVWRGRRANIEDLIRLVVNALLAAIAGYILLDADYHPWMGTLALGMAIVYAVQAWAAEQRAESDPQYQFAVLAVAMAFLAMVFPLEFDKAWIAVGWAAQGLALWWFGLHIHSWALRGLGLAFLILAPARLLVIDTLVHPAHTEVFIPLFNTYGLPALAIAASLVVAALLVRRTRPLFGSPDFVSMRILGLAGVILAWIVLSVEAYDYYMVQIDRPPGLAQVAGDIEKEMEASRWAELRAEREVDLRYTAMVAMSVVWAAYAALVLWAGFRLDNRPLRWVALGIFGLTLLKVVMVDMGRLPGFYRVAAFFALSLMMAAAAWGYQKLRHVYHAPARDQS